ncbi:hypothetical protein D9619_000345 [Psilocybe cf. subviscida]|uniref:Uncharacterized protein n=1 Tax=Psilocybe cf. subviscida TaxID=2480587 RepID=A0A8H5BDC2_9AGAR|nr:hypothetical protein D9619_000345 [Psilocybe cf. subviscida]
MSRFGSVSQSKSSFLNHHHRLDSLLRSSSLVPIVCLCHLLDSPYADLIMSSFFGLGKTRTFKPRKDVPEGTKQYQLRKYAEATLVCTI